MRFKTPPSWPCLVLLMILASPIGGCHLDRGKLYFDELGLDPITVYQMAPLEKTVFCLTEARSRTVENFDYLYSSALQDVESDLQADWSELVCLSLSGQAKSWQLTQTVKLLDRVEEAQAQESNPVSGFKSLMEDRLAIYADIDDYQKQLLDSAQQLVEESQIQEQEIERFKVLVGEQNKKILQLKQQVRELKEIELLLHPKQ